MTAIKSCKKSKTNFFFQSINSFIIFLLLILILPTRIDEYLDQWNSIRIFHSHLPKIGIALVLFFVSYLITSVTNLQWGMLFRTKLRDSVKNLEDLDIIFDKVILPASVNYGKEYFLSAINVRNACKEAEEYLNEKSYKNFIDYLMSSDMLADEPETKKAIVVSTVHKAKGLEWDYVFIINY